MIIKKFMGKTEEEANAKAKEELGEGFVVMNVKVIKPKGIFKVFKASSYEITAAKEEEEAAINPAKAMMDALRAHENVSMVADEKITIPPIIPSSLTASSLTAPSLTAPSLTAPSLTAPSLTAPSSLTASSLAAPQSLVALKNPRSDNMKDMKMERRGSIVETNGLEEKLESLQSLLEKQFDSEKKTEPNELSKEQPATDERFSFIKMIYGIMLENEINEKYVNQIMDEVEKIMRNGSSVDYILSNIYQKMILKLGQPRVIEVAEKKPKVIFFIGPTGVGKTTTIAKIASKFKMEMGKKVALLTADTYRIAATEQLRTYANILNTPLTIIYSGEELNEAVERVEDYDLVFVDTAGFSHRNEEQRNDIKKLIDDVDEKYEKEVYLVLSATTKYRDLLDIADTYKENFSFRMIFTKLDETTCYGNIFNLKMYTGADLSYSTYGQNVPDDIEVFDSQKIVKLLLGGK